MQPKKMTEVEKACQLLFNDPEHKTSNIKFFVGTNRNTTAEKMAEEFNKGFIAFKEGKVEEINLKDY